MGQSDWDPTKYESFASQRLQPALDLLSAVGALPAGGVVDLGCGSGVMGAALKARFPDRNLIGVDSSPAMLAKAQATGAYDVLAEADIAGWLPSEPAAMIFSNAALQWLGGHEALLHHLKGALAPGGTLAVQMPHQNEAPSHRAWHDVFGDLFPGRSVARGPEVHGPEWYHRTLSAMGRVRVWETYYFQRLDPSDKGHPVRLFTESTYGKPFLDACADTAERDRLIAAYEARIGAAYPAETDGSVLFPFRRLFFIYGV